MEAYHPYEKLLECTLCVMKDKRLLTSAIQKEGIDYVVLEDNGTEHNPATMKEELEALGCTVKVLDVTGESVDVILRAGALMDEPVRAERAAKDYSRRLERVLSAPYPPKQNLLVLLSIRHPADDRIFLFALSDKAALTPEILEPLNAKNVVQDSKFKTLFPGLVEIESLGDFLSGEIDAIAVTGDAQSGILALNKTIATIPPEKLPSAVVNHRIFPVPYYCGSLQCRKPRILELWKEALME